MVLEAIRLDETTERVSIDRKERRSVAEIRITEFRG